MMNGDVEDDG